MTKDETLAVTSQFHDLFYTIVREAWDEWLAVKSFRANENLGPIMYNRVVANYIFDAIARRAVPAFHGKENVTVKNESQTFKLLFGGLCARFKKGDENNLAMNIPTFAALAFENTNLDIPGLPAETAKLDIIWRPNELWTDLDKVLLVSRDGDEILWDYEIQPPAVAIDKSVFKFNNVEAGESDESPMVKPKIVPVEKNEDK